MFSSVNSDLESFNASFAKSEFKEKMGRLVQYGCRGLLGLMSDLGVSKENSSLVETLKLTQTSIGDALRVAHLFKELAIIPGLSKDLEKPCSSLSM